MSYRIEIDGSDVHFSCEPTETLLDAALRQGIEMPYSCRKGVCGNCRGHVSTGLVQTSAPSHSEVGNTHGSEHLFCCTTPCSDLRIAPQRWQRVDPDARKTIRAKVFKILHPTDDVTLVQLRFAAGARAKFKAGQYLQIVLPDGQRRSYSMANPPHENDGVQLHIRHVPGGYFSSTLLPGLQTGDWLDIELPYGDFWLREDEERPLLMVAGGTGFAPIKAIMDHMVKSKLQRPIRFYWGARQPEGIYAIDIVRRWEQQLTDFRCIPVVSEAHEGNWSGRTGLVHQAVAADIDDLNGHDAYVCGAPAMVEALRTLCIGQRNLPASRFFSDAFVH